MQMPAAFFFATGVFSLTAFFRYRVFYLLAVLLE